MRSIKDTTGVPLCSAGHVLVITLGFQRAAQGSAVVMRNLLLQFLPGSFTVLTGDVPPTMSSPIPSGIKVFTLPTRPPYGLRGERLWRDLSYSFIESRIKQYVRKLRPVLIVAVYPSLHMFSAAMNAALANGIPWVAYLHDLLAEQYRGTKYEEWAEDVETKMFSTAKAVMVTGRGMLRHYRSKHNVECIPLEIGYCEPIARELTPTPKTPSNAFVGGSVYSANNKAVARLIDGAERSGIRFTIATPESWKELERYGIVPRPLLKKAHYPERKDYVAALGDQHILVVGLNWGDECMIAKEELATAFPTKVVEYLAAGRPILAHCPEDYFLAQFFQDHECGVVISTREAADIEVGLKRLLKDDADRDQMRRNALRAAEIFSIDRISDLFRKSLQNALTPET